MRRVLVALCFFPLLSGIVRAQQDSLLVEAMRLATEGQGDSARAFIAGYLERLSPRDSLYPEALYAAGIVAGNTDDARMYLRRVSIEFSQSSWADDALLRLAQIAYAEQDFSGALRAAQRLTLDYPFSSVYAEANYWAARANLEQGDVAAGCSQLQHAETAAGENVELANRVRFYKLRCSAAALTTREDPTLQRPTAPPGQPGYSVQMAALQSAGAADELMRALHDGGYQDVRVVQEGGFLKVRVGPFSSRAEAGRVARELARKFGGKPFVVEQP